MIFFATPVVSTAFDPTLLFTNLNLKFYILYSLVKMDPSEESKPLSEDKQNARDRVAMIMNEIEADTKAELKRELMREAKVMKLIMLHSCLD